LEVDAEAAEERLFGGHLHNGFVVAVSVEQSLAFEARERAAGGILFEELREQESLAG
jgi:hypothetical protein